MATLKQPETANPTDPEGSAPVDSDRPITEAEYALAEEIYVRGLDYAQRLWDETADSVTKAQCVISAQGMLDRLRRAGFELTKVSGIKSGKGSRR